MKNTIRQYYAYSFFRNLSFYSAVLIPFFTDWGHLSLTQTQLLQSWAMVWIFLLEVPTGVVADYFGRKYALAIGSTLIACAVLIYGSIPDFRIFLTCEFLFALSMSLTSGTDEALVYDSLKEQGREKESQKIFGRAYFFRLSGVLVASLIGGTIASHFGINAAMRLAAIPFFIASIIAWNITEPKVKTRSFEEKTTYFQIIKKGWAFFSRHRTVKLLSLDGIVVSCAAYFVFWLYQPFLQRIGISLTWFGVFGASLMLVQMLVAANFTFFEKIFGSSKRMLQFGAIATALAFFLVAIHQSIVTIIVLFLFGGGFGLTRATLMSTYINKYVPSEQRATILSFISLFRRFSLALLNPLIGLMADRSLSLAFLLIGLLPLTVFLFSPIEKEMFEKS